MASDTKIEMQAEGQWLLGSGSGTFPGGNSTLTCISESRLAPGGKSGEGNKILAHDRLNTPREATVPSAPWLHVQRSCLCSEGPA